MKKFNPKFHSCIVDNVRREARKHGIETANYTDEEIYNVFKYCYLSTEDESSQARLDLLKAGEKVTE